MPDVTFLGTSGALPTADRGYTSLVISDSQIGVLVDCGAVVYQSLLRAAINPDAVTDLFITHAHIDHIAGLPSLLECLRLSGRSAPLRLWTIPETMETVQGLLSVFDFEIPLPLPFPLELHALEGDGICPPLGDVAFSFTRVHHSIPTAGLKLRFPGENGQTRTVVYSADTRPIKSLEAFAQHADLLILECTFLNTGASYATQAGHMTAGQAGQLAAAAQAKQLALVHLGAHGDWTDTQAHSEAAEHFTGPILLPADGERLSL
jgi:ribonuclease Z